MHRTRLALAASALALSLGGCSSTQLARSTEADSNGAAGSLAVNHDGRHEHNVGYGDALGAAIFGQPVTIAKSEQFGDTRYAGGETELMPGE